MGLGLAIVRRVAALLGHRVEVVSRVGRGSRFRVLAPRWRARANAGPRRFSTAGSPRHMQVPELVARSAISTAHHPVHPDRDLAAVLDNVTTVVLLTPVTLSIARTLKVSPFPYLISQIFASNIGGTATLIGDPPNILIGSAAGLDFGAFLLNLAPVVVVIMFAFVGIMWLAFGRNMEDDADRLDILATVDPGAAIKDRPLMIRALLVLGLTLVGFLFHSVLGLEAATIALLGATVLMLVGRLDPHEALRDIEWNTLFFFVGLFMLIEAVVHVGIVAGIADALAEAAGGDLTIATMGILWFSAIASAIVDNIPYTATAIPIVQQLADSGLRADPMWWALALGACLGGNLTIVGASANIVVANLAARDGHPITFMQFFRYGLGVVVASLLISTVYL